MSRNRKIFHDILKRFNRALRAYTFRILMILSVLNGHSLHLNHVENIFTQGPIFTAVRKSDHWNPLMKTKRELRGKNHNQKIA